MTNTTNDITIREYVLEEINSIEIPEELNLSVPEAMAIVKGNENKETIEAVMEAFKLGFSKGQRSKIDIDFLDNLGTDIRYAASQILALELIEESETADLGSDYRKNYLFGLQRLLDSIAERYSDLMERI